MAELSTLCYMEKDGAYLMLHRTVKKNDVNKDKWIGVGGHFEDGESPEECIIRETWEETGYTLTSMRFRGIVTFVSGDGYTEYMHLFTADGFTRAESYRGETISASEDAFGEGPVDAFGEDPVGISGGGTVNTYGEGVVDPGEDSVRRNQGLPEGYVLEAYTCSEGELVWVPKTRVTELNIWEGDKIFLKLLAEEEPFFSLKLEYNGGNTLVGAWLNGKPIDIRNYTK